MSSGEIPLSIIFWIWFSFWRLFQGCSQTPVTALSGLRWSLHATFLLKNNPVFSCVFSCPCMSSVAFTFSFWPNDVVTGRLFDRTPPLTHCGAHKTVFESAGRCTWILCLASHFSFKAHPVWLHICGEPKPFLSIFFRDVAGKRSPLLWR